MSAAAKYGSDNVSLWTPSATGSNPLNSDIVAWIDAEDTSEMTTFTDSGHSYVDVIKDKINDISFGAPANYQRPRFSNGTDSLLINNRNTLHFWEASLQSTPDTALTATLDAFDGHLAEINDPRYAFMVYKPIDYYGDANFLYHYGDSLTGKAYGLAMWVTGSGTLTNTSHYYYMASYGGGKRYYPDESDTNSKYYNKGGVPNLVYHQHSGTGGYLSNDGNQTAASYSGLTLTTNNFNRDMQFWIGEEIGGGGRGIEFLLAEMIMITGSSLSDADRQRVEGYLAHKWGLTGDLAGDHPYKSAAPTNGISVGPTVYFGDDDKGRIKNIDPGGSHNGPVSNRFKAINCNYGKIGVDQVPFTLQQPGVFSLKRRTTAYQVTRGESNE
tara:strand:+ start:1558 stop:2709 length:1152 start_codon:yes stop_codon:yes gene_type:complete